MSFLRWFGKRASAPESEPSTPSDLDASDATLPLHHALPADKGSRRSERVQRRELLYGVVRECMTAAGLLSSTYKFKVLSLDSGGREYLIMMDVPHEYLAEAGRTTDLEGSIARSAKERFGMLVTAVYWRVNDMVTVRPAVQPVPHATTSTKKVEEAPSLPAATSQESSLADEALAFKRALAAAPRGTASVKPGEVVKSGRRHPEPQPDFSDTEPFDPNSPLGPSQFGGLN